MTCEPEECFYALNDCKANVVVVENPMQLDKILQVLIPNLNTLSKSSHGNYGSGVFVHFFV